MLQIVHSKKEDIYRIIKKIGDSPGGYMCINMALDPDSKLITKIFMEGFLAMNNDLPGDVLTLSDIGGALYDGRIKTTDNNGENKF